MKWYPICSDDPLAERAERTATYGAFSRDLLISRWRCQSCDVEVEGPPPMSIPVAEYRSLDEAEASLRRSVSAALAHDDAAPECDQCEKPASLMEVEFHFFHSQLDRDIVLLLRGSELEQNEWTHDGGYAPLRPLSEEARTVVVARDAILRAAQAYKEHNEHPRMAATLVEALAKIPAEPMLMRFMPRLHQLGALELALRIADAHREHRPDNPEGHFWSGQAIVEAITRGEKLHALLPEVEARFRRALELCPDYPDAEIGVANLARFRKEPAEAERVLGAMLERHPTHAVGSYTLGLVLLDERPAQALDCFTVSEAADGKDAADYPRGRARALLKLARLDEALLAAQRAKLLAPADKRIDNLIAEILQRRAQ